MIYLTADLHGDKDRLKEAAVKRLKKRDTLIVLGDFGFVWQGTADERRLLKWLGSRPYTLLFLDGAHENFDLLAQYPTVEFAGGQARQLGGSLYQLLRGESYLIEGRRLLCMGGGESGDRAPGQEGVAWWAKELPGPAEMEHCLATARALGGRVDYLLTHTPPARISRFLFEEQGQRADPLGEFLDQLAAQVRFDHWYFGRCHLDKAIGSRFTAVYRRVLPLWQPPRRSIWPWRGGA